MDKIWVLGDAVVDLLPEGTANCCNVPAVHRQMWRSASPDWAEKVPLLAGLATIRLAALCENAGG